MAHFITCQKPMDTTTNVANPSLEEVYKSHGVPHFIVSDWDSKFAGHFGKHYGLEHCDRMRFQHFHPQTGKQKLLTKA